MTRAIVYVVSLVLTVACTVMTIASIVMPRWASYSPNGERKYSYGLHRRCSAVTGVCTPFPRNSDCVKDASFCNMWRTVGFLTSFGVVVELCTLVSFVVIIAGGVQRRVQGWGIVSSVLLFSAFVQAVGMAIVAFLFENNPRFWNGWHLDVSWTLCTASWTLLVITSAGIAASAYYLPYEGDYEFIPDQSQLEPDDRLLSRIAAWDNGYKGDAHQYAYQRDQDAQSITSFVSERSQQSRRYSNQVNTER